MVTLLCGLNIGGPGAGTLMTYRYATLNGPAVDAVVPAYARTTTRNVPSVWFVKDKVFVVTSPLKMLLPEPTLSTMTW